MFIADRRREQVSVPSSLTGPSQARLNRDRLAVDVALMVELCPCGCGREVGFFQQGSGRAVQVMDQRLAALRDLLPTIDAQPICERRLDELRAFEQHGQNIRAWFLANIHGYSRPGVTPDLVAIKRAMDAWTDRADAILDMPANR